MNREESATGNKHCTFIEIGKDNAQEKLAAFKGDGSVEETISCKACARRTAAAAMGAGAVEEEAAEAAGAWGAPLDLE